MRGYWTKHRMSCFPALPHTHTHTKLSGGRALFCALFSPHYSHFTVFPSSFPTATTLFHTQLGADWRVDHGLYCACFYEAHGWHIKRVVDFFLCALLFLDYYCACVEEKQK